MKDTEKRGRLSSFFKSFSDKIQGKEAPKKIDTSKMSDDDFCELVIKDIGGFENLILVDSCITRLRIEVKEAEKINSAKIEALGSEGIIKVGENRLQIIFGDKAALIEKHYNKIKKNIEERLHHHSK